MITIIKLGLIASLLLGLFGTCDAIVKKAQQDLDDYNRNPL